MKASPVSKEKGSGRRKGLLWWMPPSVATFIYTVLLKPKPLRQLASRVILALIPERIEVAGVWIVLNPEDAIVSGNLVLGCYEAFNLELFDALLRPGMHVLDVGANIGLYSAIAADRVGEAGLVIAVEPDAKNCDFVKRTKDLNGFNHLIIIQRAAAGATGAGRLYLNAENKADHRIFDPTGSRPSVAVALTRLDDLVAELDGGPVDLVKMDVQGSEVGAFKGLEGILNSNASCRVIMEFWPWGIARAGDSASALLDLIAAARFDVYEIDGDARELRRVARPELLLRLDKEREHVDLLLVPAGDRVLAEARVSSLIGRFAH